MRDRLGVKPLFYAVTDDSVIFASELRVMLAHPRLTRQVDLVSFNDYLTFEYVPTPRSMIKGIKKLPPGHTLTWRDGTVTLRAARTHLLHRHQLGPGRGQPRQEALAVHRTQSVDVPGDDSHGRLMARPARYFQPRPRALAVGATHSGLRLDRAGRVLRLARRLLVIPAPGARPVPRT